MLTPLVAPAGVANSSCTAAAASPVRSNFLTIALAAAFDLVVGRHGGHQDQQRDERGEGLGRQHDAPVEAGHPHEPAQRIDPGTSPAAVR